MKGRPFIVYCNCIMYEHIKIAGLIKSKYNIILPSDQFRKDLEYAALLIKDFRKKQLTNLRSPVGKPVEM
jgi:hypothetical protein